jgi:hypothetical protein
MTQKLKGLVQENRVFPTLEPMQDETNTSEVKTIQTFKSMFNLFNQFQNNNSDQKIIQAYSYFENLLNNNNPLSIQAHQSNGIYSLTMEFLDSSSSSLVSLSIIIDKDKTILTGTGKHDLLIEQNNQDLNVISAHLLSKPS